MTSYHTTTQHPTIHVNTTLRTVRCHSNLETLLVSAELADVACLCCDVTVGEVTALVLQTVSLLHRPPEESLHMTRATTHSVNVMSQCTSCHNMLREHGLWHRVETHM